MKYLATLLLVIAPAMAGASETVTYSYDAKGRLTQVARSGSANNGVTAAYAFDKADNRTSVNVTGSPFTSAQRVIVLPLAGMPVIPFPAF